MAEQNINVSQVLNAAFGYVATPYFGLKTADLKSKQSSLLGTPLMFPVTLDNFQLPNEPIVNIRGSKTIVRTGIDGMKGSFKELFSLDDYEIDIMGLAINEDGSENYPEQIVRRIRELFENKKFKSIDVTCELLGFFAIDKIVITNLELPYEVGVPSVQPYRFTCLSDSDIILILNPNLQ